MTTYPRKKLHWELPVRNACSERCARQAEWAKRIEAAR